jgi:signal transduction histidine kinase
MLTRPLNRAFLFVASVLFVPFVFQSPAQPTEPLTNAADVLALPAQDALLGLPIRVTGVVTAAETNWNGRFFVQDSSAGVFVENKSPQQPVAGDLVAVTGISHPGGYAPIIKKPHWEKIGTAPLPAAKPVTIERLMSGTEDSQRVEISGIVRTARLSGDRVGIELVSGGYRLRAYFPLAASLDLPSLVGAKVTIRGTAAAAFNAPLRQFLTVTLFAPQLADFVVNEAAPTHPFEMALTPLTAIAQYRNDRSPGNQVHVQGAVAHRNGEDLFLQDATGALQVKTKLSPPLAPGEVVEAVGFPAVVNLMPVLEDALVRQTPEPPALLLPRPATIAELQKGLHHSEFITLRGRLIDRLVRGIGQSPSKPDVRTTLVLQSTNFMFTAEKDTADENGLLAAIPVGSLLEASGICVLERGDGKIRSVRLLLPTSRDVRIIAKPSWLTPGHLLVSLAVVLGVLCAAMSWIVLAARRNAVLKQLIREKEAAQLQLQQAHDELEERVKERTAQLKVEMTARQESELQFRAVLTERTRLAQELHDTLEQTMTGIALQQDLVASQFDKNPDNAAQHLKLARKLMRRGQVDLRHSVWALRSRAEEQFNLANALLISIRQITGSTRIQLELESSGEPRDLSEVTEENLLRIGQEAVTNVVKHSGATRVKIELQFNPQAVVLQIADNGKGFVPENCLGPKDGHFGLLGIRERTERLCGEVLISSSPGAGTTLRVEIPAIPVNGHHLNAPLPLGATEPNGSPTSVATVALPKQLSPPV